VVAAELGPDPLGAPPCAVARALRGFAALSNTDAAGMRLLAALRDLGRQCEQPP
jgi:hypothetical protein